ncbi:MAG: PhzF family phenazine biosynthesis protein [Acidobacteria bacterium]|nr:PhzF family phenazine biosynthesis protein [Acidobacteriota bacterium]
MDLTLYQVDAFASEVFKGNPAAICPLERWLPDALMLSIAMENNLAETAFFVKKGERYGLRWFTPTTEMDLCGHATLASAYVIFRFLEPEAVKLEFETRSGVLVVEREGSKLVMDFPARPPERVQPCAGLLEALGGNPKEVWAARDYMVLYETEEEVRALKPNLLMLCELDRFAVMVTAPSSVKGVDFVSRFFAPEHGVPEDPVTGSAHCTLVPYWAARLGENRLIARQVSARGGELDCELRGDRVRMGGEAVLYLRGTIEV